MGNSVVHLVAAENVSEERAYPARGENSYANQGIGFKLLEGTDNKIAKIKYDQVWNKPIEGYVKVNVAAASLWNLSRVRRELWPRMVMVISLLWLLGLYCMQLVHKQQNYCSKKWSGISESTWVLKSYYRV